MTPIFMENVYFILKEKSHVYGYVYAYTPRLHVYKKLLNAAALAIILNLS